MYSLLVGDRKKKSETNALVTPIIGDQIMINEILG